MYVVNLSLKGNNSSILFTPDYLDFDGKRRGSRFGRGLRLAYNYNNYAKWWYGIGRKYDAYCFGPFQYVRYIEQCVHFSIGKFTVSFLFRKV